MSREGTPCIGAKQALHDPTAPTVYPCGLIGEHVAACDDCGKVALLGWAHVCRECWDKPVAVSGVVSDMRPDKNKETHDGTR